MLQNPWNCPAARKKPGQQKHQSLWQPHLWNGFEQQKCIKIGVFHPEINPMVLLPFTISTEARLQLGSLRWLDAAWPMRSTYCIKTFETKIQPVGYVIIHLGTFQHVLTWPTPGGWFSTRLKHTKTTNSLQKNMVSQPRRKSGLSRKEKEHQQDQ